MYTIKTLITKKNQKYSINDDYFQQNPVPCFLVRFSKLILCYIDSIYVLVRQKQYETSSALVFVNMVINKEQSFSTNYTGFKNFKCSMFEVLQRIMIFAPFDNILFIQGKCRPLFGTYDLWAGRDISRAIPAMTRDLTLHGVIRSPLLRQARGPEDL